MQNILIQIPLSQAIAPTAEDLYGEDMESFCIEYPENSNCYGDSGGGIESILGWLIIFCIVIAAALYNKK